MYMQKEANVVINVINVCFFKVGNTAHLMFIWEVIIYTGII